MKKTVLVLFLLIVIVITFSFVILRLLANGPENNFFNQKYRTTFASHRWLRPILGLHFDGDGKSDYLGKKYSRIVIEVDEMAGLQVPQEALDLLVQNMTRISGKQVSYYNSDRAIPYKTIVNQEEVDTMVNLYRNYEPDDSTASVYLLYLASFEDHATRLGTTHQEYGMVLFDTALQQFTQSSPETFSNYLESTALHEFGHLVGLPHNDEIGCLMAEHAEESYVTSENAEDVLVDFCDYEKDQIKIIQNQL